MSSDFENQKAAYEGLIAKVEKSSSVESTCAKLSAEEHRLFQRILQANNNDLRTPRTFQKFAAERIKRIFDQVKRQHPSR